MEKIFTLLIGIVFSLTILNSQDAPPQAFSYKATITKTLPNGNMVVLANKTIGLKINILQSTDDGTIVYSESFKPSTNTSGQIDIIIGRNPDIGSNVFSSIKWSEDIFFLQVWVDILGGDAYGTNPMSTTQLLSVPYSLNAGNGFATIYNEANKRPILGERGNVSIGTSSKWDWSELDVNGGINILPGQWDWGSGLALSAWDAKGGGGDQYLIGSTGAMAHEGPGKFFIRNTNHYWDAIFIMDDAGKVGIDMGFDGLPQYTLDVAGDINFTGNLRKNGSLFAFDFNNLINKPDFTLWDKDYTNDVNITDNQTIGGNKTFTGTTTVPTPVNATDAATKAYVDAAGGGATTHYIGESFCGGIVFFVYDNGQHGLIAAIEDQSAGVRWYAGTGTNTMALSNGIGAGKMNTALIIASQGLGDGVIYAARVCNEYKSTVDGWLDFGEWYLPSEVEFYLMHWQKDLLGLSTERYWTSNESSLNQAWGFQRDGDWFQYPSTLKGTTCRVRAIRSF